MRSFVDLERLLGSVPADVVQDLKIIERSAGREERHRGQIPALLDRLAHRARVESVRASNALEKIEVEPRRLKRVVAGQVTPRTRPEAQVAGYRDALDAILQAPETFNLFLVLQLHRLLFSHTDVVGGRMKVAENSVVDRLPDGQQIDRFRTVAARDTEFHMRELHARLDEALSGPRTRYHPILVIGVYVLDLLVIHPFDDGNGRTARLATTALLCDHGYSVVRYVSIDNLIDRTSDDYYSTLLASTEGWHEGRHDAWPWLRYLVARIREAYTELDRLVENAEPKGTKSDRIRAFILNAAPATFTKDDIRAHFPDTSDATINRVLAAMSQEGLIRSEGSGPSTRWTRL